MGRQVYLLRRILAKKKKKRRKNEAAAAEDFRVDLEKQSQTITTTTRRSR